MGVACGQVGLLSHSDLFQILHPFFVLTYYYDVTFLRMIMTRLFVLYNAANATSISSAWVSGFLLYNYSPLRFLYFQNYSRFFLSISSLSLSSSLESWYNYAFPLLFITCKLWNSSRLGGGDDYSSRISPYYYSPIGILLIWFELYAGFY